MAEITGKTRLFGILADPIHHVKTPQAINALLTERGYDGVLVPLHAKAEELTEVVTGLRKLRNLGGLIITVPHKTAMLALCDEVSDNARRIGAVNTVRVDEGGRLVGDMLDGPGFVGGLVAAGLDPKGKTAYLAGAGGAASGIAFALADWGVSRLTIYNRTRAKAEDLADRVREAYPTVPVDVGTSDPSGNDFVVNGTSLGMSEGDALPFDAERLTADQIVGEVIMQPEVTPILAIAKAKGCRTQPGKPMLMCQLSLMADFVGMKP